MGEGWGGGDSVGAVREPPLHALPPGEGEFSASTIIKALRALKKAKSTWEGFNNPPKSPFRKGGLIIGFYDLSTSYLYLPPPS